MIIITKSLAHVRIEGDACTAPFSTNITLTIQGWQELRDLTPEAVALKELVTAVNDLNLAGQVAPHLVSALQEARVLTRRMEPVNGV